MVGHFIIHVVAAQRRYCPYKTSATLKLSPHRKTYYSFESDKRN